MWGDGDTSLTKNFLTTALTQTFTAMYINRPPKAYLVVAAPVSSRRRKRSAIFDARSSLDPEGEKLQLNWRFSDGTKSSGETVKKTFTRDGVYSVQLTVSDSLGATARVRKRVAVSLRRGIRVLPR